jgi:hypothetical protein
MKKFIGLKHLLYGCSVIVFLTGMSLSGYSQEKTGKEQGFGSITDSGELNTSVPHENGPRKFFFGGMVGLRFGSITDIQLTPLTGYRITPRLSAGVGFKYEYYREKNIYYSFNTHIYGPRIFTRYLFLKSFSNILPVKYNGGLFLEAEAEALSLEKEYFDYPTYSPEGRFWLISYFVGIGLREPVSQNSAVNFILLYNLHDVENSPYSNPLFRIELTF